MKLELIDGKFEKSNRDPGPPDFVVAKLPQVAQDRIKSIQSADQVIDTPQEGLLVQRSLGA
jgi:hypothetical protein